MRVVYALLTITMLVSCGSEDIVQEQQCKGLWSNWTSEGSNYNIDLTGGSFGEPIMDEQGEEEFRLLKNGIFVWLEIDIMEYFHSCNTLYVCGVSSSKDDPEGLEPPYVACGKFE